MHRDLRARRSDRRRSSVAPRRGAASAARALLQFDQAVDLQRGKLGKLLGGRFDGPITIRGTPSHPGADDDLTADTKNVKMDTDKIWTPEPVRFRFGKHTGSGRRW